MNRKDLIDRVAKKFNLRKKDSEAIVKFIFKEIAETVKKGERVTIQNFGVFDLKELKERDVVNPRTRVRVKLPGRKKVYFISKF